MKPLLTCQRILTWVFIIPFDKMISKGKKSILIAANFFGFLTMICQFVFSVYTFVIIMFTDLEAAVHVLGQIVSPGACLNIMIIAFFLRHKIVEIFKRLSKIYKDYEDADSFFYLAEANNTSERTLKIYLVYSVVSSVAFLLVYSFSVLVCIFVHGRFDAKHVFHVSKIRLPWNQETLNGYIAESFMNILIVIIGLLSNGLFLMIFISLAWIFQSLSKMYRHSANKLNNSDKKYRNQKAEEILCNLIDFQNMTRQFFMQIMQVFNPLNMIQLICNMLLFAISAFELFLQYKEANADIYIFVMAFSFSILNLFLYCYFGKLTSHSFGSMAKHLYELDWHELPIKMQKYLIPMIQNAQRPLYYRGFGMITLNLETFCSLIQTAFSFFMLFITQMSKESRHDI